MKSIIPIFVLLTLGFNFLLAQAPPQSLNYQAVARDNSGSLLANQNVSFQMSILKGGMQGQVVYVEQHFVTSDDFGMVSFKIGNGNVQSGTFSEIDWGADTYYLKTEFDENGGTNFTLMGTSQLVSVPYALYADNINPKNTSNFKFPDGQDIASVLIPPSYTVPSGKNLIIPADMLTEDMGSSSDKIIVNGDTLWGNWHFIAENSSITHTFNNNIMGYLMDKKTEFITILSSNNYLVPTGKKLYLFLPKPSAFPGICSYIGRFRINGSVLIDPFYQDTNDDQVFIFEAGTTLEYIDEPNCTIFDLPERAFTGFLRDE